MRSVLAPLECVTHAYGGYDGVYMVVGRELTCGGQTELWIILGYEVIVLAGGVVSTAALDVHEGHVYGEALDRTERQT